MSAKHAADCYQTILSDELVYGLGWHHAPNGSAWPPTDMPCSVANAAAGAIYSSMAQRYNLPQWGCAVHCTCKAVAS